MTIRTIDPLDSTTGGAIPAGEADIAPPASFLQTPFWAGFKGAHGWKPLFFIVDELLFLSVLIRPVARAGAIAYIPLPGDAGTPIERRGTYLAELAESLKPYLPANTIFIRFDPTWCTVVPNAHGQTEVQGETDSSADSSAGPLPDEPEGICAKVPVNGFPEPVGKPAVRASSNTQPPDSVILDLTIPEDELLAQMKAKWRYNVKLAEKKGVTIRFLDGVSGATEGIDIFYGLYLDTAKRDGIAVHSKAYYASLVTRAADYRATKFDKPVSVRVYVAEHEGLALASIITLFCGEEAVYLYGASSNEKRNLMPAYALQWRAIRDAARSGCTRYDFYGISPTDDPTHPMSGLYRFKTGFGGSIIHRVGSWDMPLIAPLYACYRMAEKLRDFWFKIVVKRLRGIRR